MSNLLHFIEVMHAAGVHPAEPICADLQRADGRIVRFRCEGERKRNGWARFSLSPLPRGDFGNWRTGIRSAWSDGRARSLPASASEVIRREIAASMQRREAEARQAIEAVYRQWQTAQPANPLHPYVTAKKIIPIGLRQRGNKLLIPMQDMRGRLCNIQAIGPDGTKRFTKGAVTEGLFWIEGAAGDCICLGEGFGTMAAIRRALGVTVVAAMSAQNLPKVARVLHQSRPDIRIIVCADDDAAGYQYATEAARYADRLVIAKEQS